MAGENQALEYYRDVERARTILAFAVVLSGLTAVLVFAGSADVDHPTPAEAFFEKYQERAPLTWDSGRIDYEASSNGERSVTTTLFDGAAGRLYTVTYVDGRKTREQLHPPSGSSAGGAYVGFVGAEVKLSTASVGTEAAANDWGIVPESIRFRDDPRAKALGARQLLVEFKSQKPNQTNLTQLLMIDETSFRLLFAETAWGAWDPQRRMWAVQTFRQLTLLNEPVDVPTALP